MQVLNSSFGQASAFSRTSWAVKNKNDIRAVQVADRVSQVLASRRQEAAKAHLSPDVAEKIWCSMIEAFTELEMTINKDN
ncbi:chorismate mutase [Streptococcus sp. FT1-106]|uniref:chorismate mutase n=1 Tax=unclassified Streptococcus TaxID=2608887 RepID=UPI003BF50581